MKPLGRPTSGAFWCLEMDGEVAAPTIMFMNVLHGARLFLGGLVTMWL